MQTKLYFLVTKTIILLMYLGRKHEDTEASCSYELATFAIHR